MNVLIDTDNESESEESDGGNKTSGWQTVTRSGRVSKPPSWHSNYATMALTMAEDNVTRRQSSRKRGCGRGSWIRRWVLSYTRIAPDEI